MSENYKNLQFEISQGNFYNSCVKLHQLKIHITSFNHNFEHLTSQFIEHLH